MNKNNWALYKSSKQGRKVISCFKKGDLAGIFRLVNDKGYEKKIPFVQDFFNDWKDEAYL